MKDIFVKYKILVNGLHTEQQYSIDGFTLKNAIFDKELFENKYDKDKKGVDFNFECYLGACFIDSKKLMYNYFESNDYEKYEVSNKVKLNGNSIIKLLEIKSEIYDKANDLEKKIRLILNIPVLFQIVILEFYDENKEFVCAIQGNKQLSCWNRLTYKINPDEFANNSRFGIDFSKTKGIHNQFTRAIEFYNDSFDSDKISTRYILIFSSLEAIFNLNAEDVTEKISKYSAKIISEENEEEYNKIYKDIKVLYNKRCDFIHGSKRDNIQEEDEKKLRFYVRKIIISYWMIATFTNKTAKQILEYLDSDEKLDLQIRIFISALNANNFTEQQRKAIEIIEKELRISIPQEIKNAIIGKVEKQE